MGRIEISDSQEVSRWMNGIIGMFDAYLAMVLRQH